MEKINLNLEQFISISNYLNDISVVSSSPESVSYLSQPLTLCDKILYITFVLLDLFRLWHYFRKYFTSQCQNVNKFSNLNMYKIFFTCFDFFNCSFPYFKINSSFDFQFSMWQMILFFYGVTLNNTFKSI